MIRRMLIHTVIATLLVGAFALAWQAFAKGQGVAGTVAALVAEREHGHDDD